jgi:hypothetical protein
MSKDISEQHARILEYVEAAYLHGLCVENLDTGELEPPRDISEVAWIADRLTHLITEAKIEELKKLKSAHSINIFDGYVENRLAQLEAKKKGA